MADSTINELNLIDDIADNDVIPIYDVSDTEAEIPTKKGTFAKILSWISNKTLSTLNFTSTNPINSQAVSTLNTDVTALKSDKQDGFGKLSASANFTNADEVIIKSGNTVYRGKISDLLKTSVPLLNATEIKQNQSTVVDISQVLSTLNPSSNYPVNSNAVNSALTKYLSLDLLAIHNIPRQTPKDISSYITDGSLWKRLNGTDGFTLFEDIYVGDYIKMSRPITVQDSYQGAIGSQYVMIAGIDTLQGNGDNIDMMYHHLVMVAGGGANYEHSQHFGRRRMNTTNTTTGGYLGSEMYTTHIGAVATSGNVNGNINQQLYAEFGSHLKTTRELLSNSLNASGVNRFGTANGCSNNWSWYSCQAVLMSEVECYGSTVWSSSGYDTGNANYWLPLFMHNNKARNNRSAYYWLKDVASSAYFCNSYSNGSSTCRRASDDGIFVRPRFVIA